MDFSSRTFLARLFNSRVRYNISVTVSVVRLRILSLPLDINAFMSASLRLIKLKSRNLFLRQALRFPYASSPLG